MQQVEAINNCLLNLGTEVDITTIDPKLTYPPGGKCVNCSVRPGIPGTDGYGVIHLAAGMFLNEKREVVAASGIAQTSCLFNCRVPDKVTVIIDASAIPVKSGK